MSIPELRDWLEANKRNLVLGLLFFLASSLSFALGYLYAGEQARPQIVVTQSAELPVSAPTKKAAAAKVSKPKPVVPPPVTIVYPSASPVATQGKQPVVPVQPVSSPPMIPNSSVPIIIPPPVAMAPIEITEVVVGTEISGDDEFIELYNPNSVAVDISSYYIKKRTSGGGESSLVSATRLVGKSIPPGRHFLITHDQGYAGAVPADATWAKSNSLAYANNAVILYNGSDAKVSEVSWTEIEKGRSSAGVPTPQNSGQ